MAGLYIHIPFCRKACHYCNFHFSTRLKWRADMVDAICKEIVLKKNFPGEAAILSSIYFGGGTPSLLSVAELAKIFDTITTCFSIFPGAEITLECNPDDLSTAYLRDLKSSTPVNRLSIGVQSFDEGVLQWMNRSHDAKQSLAAVRDAQDAGFDNLTIDLIYGLPIPYDHLWEDTLTKAIDLQVPHLSCYALTVEPKTALAHQLKSKLSPPPSDEVSGRQFLSMTQIVRSAGYRHYEISNMAKPGYEARHNSSYWKGEPYLGIGPSAHSYRPFERSWNVSNNAQYMDAIAAGVDLKETELLTTDDRYNEYIMTGLRLEEGVDTGLISAQFGRKYLLHLQEEMKHLQDDHIRFDRGILSLTDTGRLWCDNISSRLFFTA